MLDQVDAEMDESKALRSSVLLLTPFQEGIEGAIRKHKGLTRHCGLNAIRGLKRAWLIAEIDPEIAVFRAITAEEEAATALISALQRKRYPGARLLSRRRHADKAGLMVFIKMLGSIFASSGWPRPTLHLQKDQTPPRIDVHLPSEGFGLEPGYQATPDEPLNLIIQKEENGGPAQLMTFAEELEKAARDSGADSIRQHIQDEANLRNQLLYAGDKGITVVQHADPFIRERVLRVFILLGLTIIILQTNQHQLLAKQALKSYLAELKVSHNEVFDLSAPEPQSDVVIEVRREGESPPRAKIRHRTSIDYTETEVSMHLRGERLTGFSVDS